MPVDQVLTFEDVAIGSPDTPICRRGVGVRMVAENMSPRKDLVQQVRTGYYAAPRNKKNRLDGKAIQHIEYLWGMQGVWAVVKG